MLVLGTKLLNTPVMSLQTGAELARTKAPMIDPRTLTVLGYELEGPLLDQHPSFLRIADVRELSNLGLIVDSSDEFVGLDDVILIKQVYEFSFNIIGLDVLDENKHKLGKTNSYTIDTESFVVEQLNVKRPLLKSFNDTELLIHRSQIVEVNNERVIVKTAATPNPMKESIRDYAKTFRSSPQTTQPEASDIFQSWP